MKSVVRHFVFLACILLLWRSDLKAESTTDETNRFAYGANIGWINWRMFFSANEAHSTSARES